MDSNQEITIKVSPKVAVAYQNATEQEKQKLHQVQQLQQKNYLFPKGY